MAQRSSFAEMKAEQAKMTASWKAEGRLSEAWVVADPEIVHLAPSDHRSTKSADGRVATEAAWLNGNNFEKEKKRQNERKALTLTGLLMEGLGRNIRTLANVDTVLCK